MQTAFTGMTTRPGSLLCKGTGPVIKIRMILDLSQGSLMQHLLFAVVVRPGNKFDSGTAMTINHIADTTIRTLNSHGAASWNLPPFCNNRYRICSILELLHR